MAGQTITSANSVFTLAILDLFPIPQQLSGYSADTAFTTESIDTVEVVMGVDGNMSAGWLPVIKRQTISIMPDSPSADMFDAWFSAQEAARELYFAQGVIVLPSVRKEFTMIKGVLSAYVPISEVGRTLRPRQFGITWAQVLPAPLL